MRIIKKIIAIILFFGIYFITMLSLMSFSESCEAFGQCLWSSRNSITENMQNTINNVETNNDLIWSNLFFPHKMIFYVFLSFLLMIIFLTREKEKTKLYIISMILQLLYIILIFIIFEILSLYNSRFINFYLNYNGTEIFLIDFQNNNFVNNFGIKTLQNLYLKYFFTILSGIIISLNFYLFVNNVRPKILKYLKIKKD